MEQRLMEATKLGFKTFVIPATHTKPTTSKLSGVHIIRCKHVLDALKAVLGTGQSRASMTLPAAEGALEDPLQNGNDSGDDSLPF